MTGESLKSVLPRNHTAPWGRRLSEQTGSRVTPHFKAYRLWLLLKRAYFSFSQPPLHMGSSCLMPYIVRKKQ